MVGRLLYLIAPLPEPVASRALTMSIDSLSATSPKTTWRPFNQEVTTVVTKNWEPLLWERVRMRRDVVEQRVSVNVRVGASVGHGQQTRLVVLQLEVLIAELLAVDGLATGALEHSQHQLQRVGGGKRESHVRCHG